METAKNRIKVSAFFLEGGEKEEIGLEEKKMLRESDEVVCFRVMVGSGSVVKGGR